MTVRDARCSASECPTPRPPTAKPTCEFKKATSMIPVTSGARLFEVHVLPPSVVFTNTGGPPQRPTATTVEGDRTRMPQSPTTVAPVIRFEMFDHVRPPSRVSHSE